LDKFGKWKPRPGPRPRTQDKQHQHRLLKKRHLRGNGSDSLVLSEEHNNDPLSLADDSSSTVVDQTTISNAVTMEKNSF
jgi:hypothetical protein